MNIMEQGCSDPSQKKIYARLGLGTHLNSQLLLGRLRQELEASLGLQSKGFCLERKTGKMEWRKEERKEKRGEDAMISERSHEHPCLDLNQPYIDYGTQYYVNN